MVTGRELPDLQSVCPALDRFDWIVAENGALLFRPADNFSKLLCPPASAALAQKLGEARAQPLSVGRAIIATREPYETLVIALIKELGLELQVIFNKGAVMVLPTGVNKATGLTAVLKDMKVDPAKVVAIGDAQATQSDIFTNWEDDTDPSGWHLFAKASDLNGTVSDLTGAGPARCVPQGERWTTACDRRCGCAHPATSRGRPPRR